MKKIALAFLVIILMSSTAFAESWILWSKWTGGPEKGKIEFGAVYGRKSSCESQREFGRTWGRGGAMEAVIGPPKIEQYCLPASVNGKEYLK